MPEFPELSSEAEEETEASGVLVLATLEGDSVAVDDKSSEEVLVSLAFPELSPLRVFVVSAESDMSAELVS